MSSLTSIEDSVKNLSKSELEKFRNWFLLYDQDKWDLQVEQDASSGRFDNLSKKALLDLSSGQAKEL